MDISPDKQNIDAVFSNTVYYIDFYQREYRWTEEPVLRFLDDVFYKFNETYSENDELDESGKIIDNKYPWYYLNTYVTNKVDGKVFVVDGQQRLTTLTLVLIKLLRLAIHYDSKLQKWLDRKICGQTGYESSFWMNHETHKQTQQAIYEGRMENAGTNTGITAYNMVNNYKIISTSLDRSLTSKHKLETFIFYFLRRLVLINLTVEQTDVPMVFEVINDRGVRLKPFEILKGKLLGQIDKTALNEHNYNAIWEDRVHALNRVSESEDETDRFFRFYLKARFANTRKEGQIFDGDYHRIIFTSKFDETLSLARNEKGVTEFLKGPFPFYTEIYQDAVEAFRTQSVSAFTYNRLNDIDGAFMLLLSSCRINDNEKQQKMQSIPAEMDRLFTLLQLQGAYDSNSFQEMLYRISASIRDREVDSLRPAFDKELVEELKKQQLAEVTEPFRYTFFKQTGVGLNARFKRYFFARIDEFLAKNMNLNMKHDLSSLVLKTGAKTGFHIEHILARNSENLELFDNDEERFEIERNRLGGVLLLKGKDNISSNNESYNEKLKSYANTLYWNETLREDTYKSKLDIGKLKSDYNLMLEPLSSFGPEALEKRQKLLFEIAKIIWS